MQRPWIVFEFCKTSRTYREELVLFERKRPMAKNYFNQKILCLAGLFWVTVSIKAQEKGCSAPPVTEGENGVLTFFMRNDVNVSSHSFNAKLTRNNVPESDLLHCFRPEGESRMQCMSTVPHNVSGKLKNNILEVIIPNVTRDSEDTYVLRAYVNGDPEPPISCNLTVEKEKTEEIDYVTTSGADTDRKGSTEEHTESNIKSASEIYTESSQMRSTEASGVTITGVDSLKNTDANKPTRTRTRMVTITQRGTETSADASTGPEAYPPYVIILAVIGTAIVIAVALYISCFDLPKTCRKILPSMCKKKSTLFTWCKKKSTGNARTPTVPFISSNNLTRLQIEPDYEMQWSGPGAATNPGFARGQTDQTTQASCDLKPSEPTICEHAVSKEKLQTVIDLLGEVADTLDEHVHKVNIAKVVGSSMASFGAGTLIVNILAAAATGGASIPFVVAGTAGFALGGITTQVAKTVGKLMEKHELNKLENAWDDVRKELAQITDLNLSEAEMRRQFTDLLGTSVEAVSVLPDVLTMFTEFRSKTLSNNGAQLAATGLKDAFKSPAMRFHAVGLALSLYDLISASIEVHCETKSPAGQVLRRQADKLKDLLNK